jgi:hypothetical protein
MVKIQVADPNDLIQAIKTMRSQATKDNLSHGTNKSNQFQHRFVPSLTWFISHHNDPWKVDDQEMVDAMCKIWKTIYDDSVPHKVHV